MSSSELKPSASASDAASDKPVDYYTLLGLGKDASKTDIEKALVLLRTGDLYLTNQKFRILIVCRPTQNIFMIFSLFHTVPDDGRD